MLKKLALFPMTRDMCAVARYPSLLLQKYLLTYLFVPSFMKLDGKDISCLDGGDSGIATLSDLSKARLADCDTLFLDYDAGLKDLTLYREIIDFANGTEKEIIMSKTLLQELGEDTTSWPIDAPVVERQTDRLYEIRTPILAIYSQNTQTDQFALELATRKHFIDQGYKVEQISSNNVSQVFGFSSTPDFLYEQRDAYDKILKFNTFVKDLTEMKQPDLFIMGVPGAIMKYNMRLLNGLGIIPFVMSTAVNVDLAALCMHYNSMYDKNIFDEISRYGQYRLGVPIQFINLANTSIAPDMSSDIVNSMKLNYINLNSEFVLQGIKHDLETNGHYLFNVLNNESAVETCFAMQKVLSENAHYMC